jgi:hypothetical protein
MDGQKVTLQPMASQIMMNRVDSGDILKCLKICFAEMPDIHGASKMAAMLGYIQTPRSRSLLTTKSPVWKPLKGRSGYY